MNKIFNNTGKRIFINIFLLPLVFALSGIPVIARDAPVTAVGSASLCQPGSFTVPITVNNFTNISGISLRLDYNPAIMTFSAFTVNTQLGTMIVNNVPVSASLHKIMIVWAETTPKSFANGTAIVTLSFNFLSGSTGLTFNNTANFGGDCEYADENGDPMNDMPSANFYKNGLIQTVTDLLNLNNVTVANGQLMCYRANQTITTAGNATTFTVQAGGTASLSAGQTISLLPGSTVQSGGILTASISAQCIPCINTTNLPGAQSGIVVLQSVNQTVNAPGETLVTLYPNPVVSEFTLSVNGWQPEGEITLTLFDQVGRITWTNSLNLVSETKIIMESLTPGIYFLKIQAAGFARVLKVVKK